MAEVKFCENNVAEDLDGIVERIKADVAGADVEVTGCLGHCDICFDRPYALVDDEVVDADSDDELVNKIKKILGN